MRNWRWPDILTGVLLAIAVFAIGYSVSSARYLSGRETGEHNQKQISNLADVLIAVWDYLTKDAITLFTIVLAVATWLLWRSTDNLWKETREAAVRTERNMVALQRPQVFVYISNAGLKVEPLYGSMTTAGEGGLQFYIANFGSTVAQLTEIRDELFVRDKGEWPVSQPTTEGRKLPPGTFTLLDLPYNEGRRYLADCVGHQDLLVAGSLETKTVHFSGWVRYVDVFGNRYISGFHYVFDPIGDRFVRRGSAEYNYTREE